jgi:phospholipid-binding lipoprotein MlaA
VSIPIWVAAMLVTGTPVADGDVQASPPAELVMAGNLQPFSTVSLIAPETADLVASDVAMVSPAAPIPPEEPEESQDIVVMARPRNAANDPIAAINTESFKATQAVDRAFVGPLALAYKRGVPTPVRSGIRNFIYNLREPIVFVNFLLQHKVGKAAETLGRFVVNSSVGVGGVFDMAKRRPIHLPRRPNGFADTLGFYGVKPGPFLFLPLIGPTTLRDFVGDTVDRLVLPLAVGKPFNRAAFTIPVSVLGVLDRRAENDELFHELHTGPTDPYVATRTFYLKRRQAEIDDLHGKHRSVPATPMPTTTGATAKP